MKALSMAFFCVALVACTSNIKMDEVTYVAKENEKLYGTWINKNYKLPDAYPKLVIYIGRYEHFATVDSKTVIHKDEWKATDKWKDSEGNIWYRLKLKYKDRTLFGLYRVSRSGKNLDYILNRSDYPKKIDPDSSRFRVYYRE